MLYLFDLDNTLISGYMDNPDKDYHTWHVLPGRVEKLRALVNAGHRIGIVTNQGGVGLGIITEDDFWRKISLVRMALDIVITHKQIAVCFAAPGDNDPRRKPSGLMIKGLMAANSVSASQGVLYVGDRDEDWEAALDADVRFMWADKFFSDGEWSTADEF